MSVQSAPGRSPASGTRPRPPRTRVRPTRALVALALFAALLLLSALPAESSPTITAQAVGEHQGIWDWPVTGTPSVENLFDAPEFFYSAGHRGLDVTASSLTISAVDDGVVTFAGPVAGKPVVSIKHANGLQSTYEPVRATVKAGDEVTRGQVIGELDPAAAQFSHCAPRLCLHIGAKREDAYIDPLPLFGAATPSVLKPLGSTSGGVNSSGNRAAPAPPTSRAPVGSVLGARVGLIHGGP